MDIWAAPMSWLLWIMLWMWVYSCHILKFWRNHVLFSRVVVPSYSLINRAQGFQFLHILVNFCHFLVFLLIVPILRSMRWHLTVALICIYLTVSKVMHLFICLVVICTSFWEKCLLKDLDQFWNQVILFLLSFPHWSSLPILIIGPLTDIVI